MFTLLGSTKCEVLSILDLKDAFHSVRLTENSNKYFGILPYFGRASYLYQRMPMGLNISPAVWQSYINAILSCLSSRKYCEAIMDDSLLLTPTKEFHFAKLEDLLKALCKNGLKISPKKCQLFKTELQYMGNIIFIKDRRVCVKPLRSRLEAIKKLRPPTTAEGCRRFAGMVNFVSIFCQKLQKLLKPIYDMTRKGRHFIWGEEQQGAFEEIKSRLLKSPVLHMPDRRGRFLLYCYVQQCYMCIDLKGCLGVRCCICRCVGALRYTMLVFGFLSSGVSQYIRRSQCNCIIKYNYLYYNYIVLLLQYHKYTCKYTLICIASCSHCCK